MMLKAFCLYDTKTGIYGTPWFMAHVGQAIRAVQDLANDPNTTIGRHPADYMLVELGFYDDQNGTFTNQQNHIGTVVHFLQPAAGATPLFDAPLSVEQSIQVAGVG